MEPLDKDKDPTSIGKYQLKARLGTGGMGVVYYGRSPGGRPVAVKRIRLEHVDDPTFRERFAREIEAARRVPSLFTAPVVDADPEATRPPVRADSPLGPEIWDIS